MDTSKGSTGMYMGTTVLISLSGSILSKLEVKRKHYSGSIFRGVLRGSTHSPRLINLLDTILVITGGASKIETEESYSIPFGHAGSVQKLQSMLLFIFWFTKLLLELDKSATSMLGR